ncbi:DUF1212-domain-containing protein [Leucogyrophana mollusca]|uniref:DUF1212-domain-containing protein n=1 Tax=Leucogyrophana mollusca TaxID=85980 RepID=A0ACB8C191_9AGAM|nr:DUF1212-domain-containing protein [Leucogyrophana mollusca]
MEKRRKFMIKLAKSLLAFGAPSHRIESQLTSASEILDAKAAFVHIPGVIIVTFGDEDKASVETHFVKANGRIALTNLHEVHLIYRKVLHDKMTVEEGTRGLKRLLLAPPLYSLGIRCLLAFVCASTICVLAFGGSIIDMWISGFCACVLQYLGLNAAAKSAMYANVYEISVSIIVSFVARALGTIPGNLFCYNAVSSAGVVLILPGFTILMSALELTSRNMLSGSVRMVYSIIYTLFLGFGLTIGSDLYLVVNPFARRELQRASIPNYKMFHGNFTPHNGSYPLHGASTFGFADSTIVDHRYILRGCYRDPSWPWFRQPLPWWTLFFLVPIYSICSSLANLQSVRSWQLLVMVTFSCCAFAANRLVETALPGRGDIVSAAGALVIGMLGNVYSRVVRGTAFTSMVTGVLFLVPSGIALGGGLLATQTSSAQQYRTGFALAIRMIQVAIGITVGLFVSQIFVYMTGRRKNAAHFAF